MGIQVRHWLPNRKIIIVADSSYAALELLNSLLTLTNPVYMVTQLRLDAALYEPAALRKPGTIGRPCKKGERLPKLSEVLEDKQTVWQTVIVDDWYGQDPTQAEITSDTAAWHHSGMPAVPLRWVLIRDPNGRSEARALLCTDQNADSVQILTWFVRRWKAEVTFQVTHIRENSWHAWQKLRSALERETALKINIQK